VIEETIFFSIVIPTFNRETFIVKTIGTVLAQTYKNFELIIVDDGSTDGTEGLISKISDSRIKYFKTVNSERGAARNYGTRKATGEYICFLDSDDLLYENHLSEAVYGINLFDKPEFIFLGYDIRTPENQLISKVTYSDKNAGSSLLGGNFLSCNSVLLRLDIALSFKFNEHRKLSVFEDWELWLRLAARFKLHVLNSITSTLVNHGDRSVLSGNKEALIIRRDFMLQSLMADKKFNEVFGKKLFILMATLDTYIALHLALTKKYRVDALKFLLKGIIRNPHEILKRRFLAILKHIIL